VKILGALRLHEFWMMLTWNHQAFHLTRTL
jgi:hypothetical protein